MSATLAASKTRIIAIWSFKASRLLRLSSPTCRSRDVSGGGYLAYTLSSFNDAPRLAACATARLGC
jgi:hypothetical protein